MNKEIIYAPSGIQYMSEWKSYELPKGHCIVDKGVTGCGYTEYCLRNDKNIVLCSPRKLLLENKSEQHQGEKNLCYFKNDLKDKGYGEVLSHKDQIITFVRANLMMNMMKEKEGQSYPGIKLLTTYDSAHYIVEALKEMEMLGQFYFVVDEFQSIFTDSYFKAEIEFGFVSDLKECPNVIYLSATPMLDKYLLELPEFKDLYFQEINWDDTGLVEKIVIKRKFASSLTKECEKIIKSYLSGKFPISQDKTGKVMLSTEAVFYFNSVTDIARVIKRCKLTPDQVNIICSDTTDNRNKLIKLSTDLGYCIKEKDPNTGKIVVPDNGFKIGRIPLKGELNKMFTFCTKTAYIGSDFYSTCASTYIFADPNVSCLALDICLDLPQIVGRQRDKLNLFKNYIVIFYKTIRQSERISKESFEEKQKSRRRRTEVLLGEFEKMSEEGKEGFVDMLRDSIKVSQYKNNFVSLSKRTKLPVYNRFIDIANQRAWDVSQEDYQDIINVTKAIEEVTGEKTERYKDEDEQLVDKFLSEHFFKTGIFAEKMKLYCGFMDAVRRDQNQEIQNMIFYKIKDDRFRRFYNYYGTSGCSAAEYREHKLREGMMNASKGGELVHAIMNEFKEGERYRLSEIKQMLSIIYREIGITKSARGSDIKDFFEVKRVKFYDNITKKRDEGYLLVKWIIQKY